MSTHITEPRAREQQTLLTALHKMMGDGSDDVRNAVSLLMSKMDRPEPNSSNATSTSYPLSLVSLVRMVCPGAMIPPQRPTEPEQASSPLQGTMLRNNKKRVPITLECVKGTLAPVVPVLNNLNILHRSAFDEIAKKDVRGVALIRLNLSHQHEAYTAYEQAFEEYITYFKTKQKAGVVRFTEGSSDETTFLLYLLPADELVLQTVLPGMTAPDKSFVAVLASV